MTKTQNIANNSQPISFINNLEIIMKKRNMPQTQTKVKIELDIKVKICLFFAMSASLCVAAGMVVGLLKMSLQKPTPVMPSPDIAVNEFGKIKEPKYVLNQIIVKFKEGVDTNRIIQEILDEPQTVYQDKSGKVLQSGSKEYQEAMTSPDKLSQLSKRELSLTVKGVKKVFSAVNKTDKAYDNLPAATTEISGLKKDLEQWEIIEFKQASFDIPALQQDFQASGEVVAAEPNYVMKAAMIPNDYYYNTDSQTPPIYSWGQDYPDLWGLKAINAGAAWDVTTGRSEAVIAVTDTGVDYRHEDLANNIWLNDDEIPDNGMDDDNNGYIDDYRGYDFCTFGDFEARSNDPIDDNGHGTHVAGTIAAEINNGIGVVGVCPNCKIMPLKGLNSKGSGLSSDLAEAIQYAADNGAKAINMSWGGTGNSQLLEDAINYAHGLDVVLVAAAGNSNDNVEFFTPAKYSNVITVASLNHYSERSNFSNWGNKIDIAAPGGDDGDIYGVPAGQHYGVNILSLRADTTDMYLDVFGYTPGEFIVGSKYYRARGTSMAAPHVAGVAGLILSNKPEFTNEQVRAAINQSATDLGETGWDQYTGHGGVNAFEAVNVKNPLVAYISQPSGVGYYYRGEIVAIKGTASGGNFNGYKVEIKTDRKPAEWITLAEANRQVINGVLATWDTVNYMGNYLLRLTVVTDSGEELTSVRNVITGFERGWPQNTTLSLISHLVTADIDPNYPGLEVVGTSSTASLDGAFELFVRHADGTMMAGWPIFISGGAIEFIAGPAVSDIDHDGDPEIVVGSTDNHVYAFHHKDINGDGLADSVAGWPQSTFGYSNVVPVLEDINNDGYAEIISTSRRGYLYVWKYTGELFSSAWPQSIGIDSASYTPIAVGNLDDDRDLEIAIAGGFVSDAVYIFNPDGTSLNSNWPKKTDAMYNNLTLTDVDTDGDLEIVSNASNKLTAYQPDGQVVFGPITHAMYQPSPVAVGDIDLNSPGYELVGAWEDKAYVWKSDGTILNARWPLTLSISQMLHFSTNSTPALADVTGDGEAEIIIGTGKHISVLNKNGEIISNVWPINLKPESDFHVSYGYTTPLVSDIDADNRLELFYAYGYQVYGFELDKNGTVPWPMYQHDRQHTGRFVGQTCADGTIYGQCNQANQLCYEGKLIKKGDLNGDNLVNPMDMVRIVNYVYKRMPLDNFALIAADVNSDGKVDAGDVTYLSNYVYKGGPAPKCP